MLTLTVPKRNKTNNSWTYQYVQYTCDSMTMSAYIEMSIRSLSTVNVLHDCQLAVVICLWASQLY